MKLLRITREGIDRLKSANPLADVVAERGIRLVRRGRHLFGLCPFHHEDTPSFVVTPEKGLFHCYGCGAGGDEIGFVVRYEGMGFRDVLEGLARRAGYSLRELMESGADEGAVDREDLCGRTSPWR